MILTYKKITTPDKKEMEQLMYQAIYQHPNQAVLPLEVIYEPTIYHYIANFGHQSGDYMIGAFDRKRLIGAA